MDMYENNAPIMSILSMSRIIMVADDGSIASHVDKNGGATY